LLDAVGMFKNEPIPDSCAALFDHLMASVPTPDGSPDRHAAEEL
jgi:hypothetical protein